LPREIDQSSIRSAKVLVASRSALRFQGSDDDVFRIVSAHSVIGNDFHNRLARARLSPLSGGFAPSLEARLPGWQLSGAGRCVAVVDAIVSCVQRFEQLPVSENNKTR
jgi:hypothetical protein